VKEEFSEGLREVLSECPRGVVNGWVREYDGLREALRL
jgi:hypothetical protein